LLHPLNTYNHAHQMTHTHTHIYIHISNPTHPLIHTRTQNQPTKVGGHVVQDCFTCAAGRYGDFESAGTEVCTEQCQITTAAIGCYDCPFANACEGKRTCKPG
jgi:hypothetical protein